MAEAGKNLTGVYRFTSIARPVDPAYPTNRALLILLPVVGLLSAGLAFFYPTEVGPLSAALNGALVAFAAWALTRELAPDDNGAAFVALAFAWFASVAFGASQVLLLFVALVLVRVVNRSTGLPLRPWDTLGALGFCTWAAINTEQPLILLIASLAFLLDATLEKPLRWHYFAAAACLPVFVWFLAGDTGLPGSDLSVWDWSLIGAFVLGIGLLMKSQPAPVSCCDTSTERLDPVRVNAGLIVGLLLGIQALLTHGRSAWLETPIWACMLALLLSAVFRLANRR